MDATQEEMKFLGLLGIFTKSFKTIITWKSIFTKITLTLILHLAITFILHMEISRLYFNKIEEEPFQLFTNAYAYYQYSYISLSTPTELLHYLLFKITSISMITCLSLLSTGAVVFTVASVYTGAIDVTCHKIIKLVPKTNKRLIITFLTMLLTFFAYNLISSVIFFLSYIIFEFYVLLALYIPYMLGFLYLAIIWQLAIVVSVLENYSGVKAMIKAIDLMKGKRMVALTTSLIMYGFLGGVVFMYMALIVFDGAELTLTWRVVVRVLCCVLIVIAFLLIMVIETVLYLVCKSCHQEAIDKVSLSTYLGAYLSDSQPAFIVGEDIHLGCLCVENTR